MVGALIILLVTIGVGLLLYVSDLKYRRKHAPAETETKEEKETKTQREEHGEICCGRHLICEKPLTPSPGEEIIYYEDEELDRFAGKNADDFTNEETEEVRDVMMTLLPEDVAGWVRSIQLRGINLPTELRDELFMLLECSEEIKN